MPHTVYRRIHHPTFDITIRSIPAECFPSLMHLARRLLSALALGKNLWQSGLPLIDLRALGLTDADCRDLLARGLIALLPLPLAEGRCEDALRTSAAGRRSIPKSSHLGPSSLIVLTETGLAYITKHLQSAPSLEPSPSAPASGYPGQAVGVPPSPGLSVSPSLLPSISSTLPRVSSPVLPHYDSETRALSVAEVVLLRLPVQGRSLIAVLTALEQSCWKSRVAKPLSGRPGGNDPHHLAIAAYKLNHRQSLIEFHADDGAFRWNWRQPISDRYSRGAVPRRSPSQPSRQKSDRKVIEK